MTNQELLNCLHRYTPWEILHIQNLNKLSYIEDVNQAAENPLSEAEKSFGLHLPHSPDANRNTFSEHLFFSSQPGQDIRITQHDRYSPPCLHNHEFYELIYVLEGEFTQQIADQKFVMQTGDICLIPPGVYHALDVQNYSVVLNILITKNRFQEITLNQLRGNLLIAGLLPDPLSTKKQNDYLIFHTMGDESLREMVLSMCLEEMNHEAYYQHMLYTLLLLILGHLLRHYETTCEHSSQPREGSNLNLLILQFIEQKYQTVTLTTLAEEFHYSPQHMSHRVRQLTGMSFTEYLLQKRMQKSAELLTKTAMKVKSISECVGYQNQEHFIRTFRKYYGFSPREYRNLHQSSGL